MTKSELLKAIQEWQAENPKERFFLVMLGEVEGESHGMLEGDMRGARGALVPAVAGMLESKDGMLGVVSDAVGLMLRKEVESLKEEDGTDEADGSDKADKSDQSDQSDQSGEAERSDKAENAPQEDDNLPW